MPIKTRVKIVVPGDDPVQAAGSPHLERLKDYGEVVLFTDRPETSDEKVRRVLDADIMINSRGVVSWGEEEFSRLSKLRMITTCSIGTDMFDLKAAEKKGIIICNQPGRTAPVVAEHMFGLMFAAAKRTAFMTAGLKAGKWLRMDNVMIQGKTLGIIGTGHQAYTHIMAHLELFDLVYIKVHDRSKTAVDRLVNSLPNHKITGCSIAEALASDIVCTLTPSKLPILKEEWIKPGTHINAVGADAKGKEELEPSILDKAMVVVDDLGQASAAGEINVPVSKGLYKVDQVYSTLSEIIIGRKKGRTDDKTITIFDSTGIAIEDIATAKLVYEKARFTLAESYNSVDLV